MEFYLYCLIFCAAFKLTSQENNTDVSTRWSLFGIWPEPERQSCSTKSSGSGVCVHLKNCPDLLNQVRHVHPGRVFENLQDYTYPCSTRGQVCCPERTGEDSWEWPTSSTSKPSWSTTKKQEHQNRWLLPDNCGISLGNRVLGGEETDIDEHPWMALLRLKLPNGKAAFVCGGSLISERYVLTAAHCVKGIGIPKGSILDMARLGEHNIKTARDCSSRGKCSKSAPQDIPIEERIVHPEYTPYDPGTYNDIALLRLKTKVRMNVHVQPVCLPLDSISTNAYEGKKLTTVGWGRTSNEDAKNSPVKRMVKVPVIPLSLCSPKYKARKILLRNTQMCAGGEEGKDSCQGDSGGPLLSRDLVGEEERWHVQGVVSTGPKECGRPESPAIYTKVTKFTTWILDNLRE